MDFERDVDLLRACLFNVNSTSSKRKPFVSGMKRSTKTYPLAHSRVYKPYDPLSPYVPTIGRKVAPTIEFDT